MVRDDLRAACSRCGRSVRFKSLVAHVRGAGIAVRCAYCMRVFCVPCAKRHFSLKDSYRRMRAMMRTYARCHGLSLENIERLLAIVKLAQSGAKR